MSIISFSFLLFLLILVIIYFIVPKKMQWAVILAANLVFYAYSGPKYLIYILSCAFFTWYAALKINKDADELTARLAAVSDKEEKKNIRTAAGKKKRNRIIAALIPTLGIWIVLKYGPFLVKTAAPIFSSWDAFRSAGTLSFIVPLGMSFYTLDAVGYMTDVSRGKYKADRSFLHYLTFVSFFPHIIQGPFSRYDTLGKTLFAEHRFSYDRLCQGASRMLWGYFKKMIIADKLAATVSEIFSGYDNYWGIQIVFVMILYGIQIYADFSGYMDIVSGASHILGITLDKNFSQPYFAVSVEDFWRRWHMTLGHWFRDYLFYPIAMGKRTQNIAKKVRERFGPRAGKLAVSCIASFWVWSATGLWHGANWTFLVWGWMNMAAMLFSQIMEPWYEKARAFFHISLQNKFWHLFRIFRTFCLVSFFRLFSRADNLHTALQILKQITQGINRRLLLHPMQLFPKMQSREVYVVLIAFIMMTATEILSEKGKWEITKEKTPFVIRNLIYVFMIYSLILFAGTGTDITANFIYANF